MSASGESPHGAPASPAAPPAASVDPALEQPRPLQDPQASDAVTFAFADVASDLYGVARLGLTAAGASGLVVLFHGGEPVAVRADGGVPVADGGARSWVAVRAAGLSTEIVEPLRSWRARLASEEASFDLAFFATGPIASLAPEEPVAKAGGMQGYEQPCRVRGTVTVGGRRFELADGLGQRGHSWGAPDWDKIRMARTLSAWFDDGVAVTAVAVRPAKGKSHADEQLAVTILEAGADGEPVVTPVPEPLLSTTYDGEGRQRRAGLELYPDPEGYARRLAGEVVCGSSLDLGRLRLDCAFFRWRMEGREGVGRYDVLRRADA
jgi:hypothetical protein